MALNYDLPNSEEIEKLITTIFHHHRYTVTPDDPIIIMYTTNRILAEDFAKKLQSSLQDFTQQLHMAKESNHEKIADNAATLINENASASRQMIHDAILEANKSIQHTVDIAIEKMQNHNDGTVQNIQYLMSDVSETLVKLRRQSIILFVSSGLAIISALIALFTLSKIS